jgi:hypothetical protein
MMLWHTLIDLYWHWIDSVSRTIDQLFERFGSRRAIRLIEGEDDTVSFELGPAVAERSNVGWLTGKRWNRLRMNGRRRFAAVGSNWCCAPNDFYSGP